MSISQSDTLTEIPEQSTAFCTRVKVCLSQRGRQSVPAPVCPFVTIMEMSCRFGPGKTLLVGLAGSIAKLYSTFLTIFLSFFRLDEFQKYV